MDIFDLLHQRDIVLRAPAQAKRSLLRLLTHTLSVRCGLPADSILAALLSREKLGSTGIGHGIAVPHALMKSLSEPAAPWRSSTVRSGTGHRTSNPSMSCWRPSGRVNAPESSRPHSLSPAADWHARARS
jgi:hypothetical protein